jgi:FkbM family methyltransferase
MLFDAHDTFIGRALDLYGEYSWAEVMVLEQMADECLLHRGRAPVVLEAGSHIGTLTLPMARRASQVYAFEPQRLVFQMLCANLAMNGILNASARQAVIGAGVGSMVVPVVEAFPDGTTNSGGLQLKLATEGDQVPMVSVDSLEGDFDLIRADIEDMEIDLLRGAVETINRCRPIMMLEANHRAQSDELLTLLSDLDYECFWHFPPIYQDDNHKKNSTNDFFQGCVSLNLLCTPRESRIELEGFAKARIGDEALEVGRRQWREYSESIGVSV